jgi:uncharacterized membrane protein
MPPGGRRWRITSKNDVEGMNKARLESFSDGVFAFAITLLVLSIPIPDIKSADDRLLTAALLRATPQLIPYVTSFATIGIIWLNHHSMFHEVEKVQHTTLTLLGRRSYETNY